MDNNSQPQINKAVETYLASFVVLMIIDSID